MANDWSGRQNEVRVLSEIDESAPYEVDQAAICYDPAAKDFTLMTASGCSCWDGDYEESHYPTLDAVAEALLAEKTGRDYNPTLAGANQLIAEAREELTKRPV